MAALMRFHIGNADQNIGTCMTGDKSVFKSANKKQLIENIFK